MKLKNRDLAQAVESLESLRGLVLDGDISLESVKLKKGFKSKLEEVDEAKRNIIESLCAKDEKGNPKRETKEVNGRIVISHPFDSIEDSQKCMDEIGKIDAVENEYPNGKILIGRIETIKCSPEQMEGLLLLTPPVS